MARQSFLDELKRRRVVRVALVYGAVTFAVLQAADIIVPRLQLPDWMVTFILVLALLGFPIALVLAWAFELTPEGVRRTEASDDGDAVAPAATSAWIAPRTVVAAVVLVAAGLLAGWLLPRDRQGATQAPAVAEVDALPSLAVLPLENVGGEAGNSAFAVGLHDDLLTQLSKIDGLRLVSRTSVREYANTTKNMRDIGSELGVGNILEGSVQRADNQVRINVQLIEAATDRHLWAETYDQDLTVANLFAIQAEIADAIARALRAELTGSSRAAIAKPPTANLTAYEAYLRGLAGGYWDFKPTAAEAFAEATRLDPSFAEAYAAEARAQSWLVRIATDEGRIADRRQLAGRARAALERATALAPDAAETKLAQGYVAYYVDWDLKRALARFREVEAVRHNDAEVAIAVGLILRRLGRWEEALAEFHRAIRLDERNHVGVYEFASTSHHLGRYDDALRYARIALEIQPRDPPVTFVALDAYAAKGDTLGIRQLIEKVGSRPTAFGVPDPWLLVPFDQQSAQRRFNDNIENRADKSMYMVYWAAARWARFLDQPDVQRAYADSLLATARKALDALDDGDAAHVRAVSTYLAGLAYAYRGNFPEAITYARRAVAVLPVEVDALEGWAARVALVEVLILAGQFDEAVTALRALIGPPSPFTIERFLIDPLMQPLRSHPDFQQIAGAAFTANPL